MIKIHAIALAAAILLAGCGGGTPAADRADTSPAATAATAAAALRAHALAAPAAGDSRKVAQAITPESSAEQLMNFGESVFPQYFPGHPATSTFGPFRFRAYANGVLLGVVVQANPDYILNGVYVMNGPFGSQPLFVGLLSSFITPTDPNPDPGPGPTGSSNGCFDLSLLDSQGSHSVVVYDITGPTSGTHTVDILVGAMVPFEGQSLRELITKTTGNEVIDGTSTPVEIEFKSYARRSGDAELTQYGATGTVKTVYAGQAASIATKSVASPPWVDKQYSLPVGGSFTHTETSTLTTTLTVPGLPATPHTTSSTTTTTVKYIGQETLTVPAGTYNSCKYQTSSSVGGTVTALWFVVGRGIMLQTAVTTSSDTTFTKARSIMLNGQPL